MSDSPVSVATVWFMVLGAVAVIVFDVWTTVQPGKTATISSTIYQLSRVYPWIPFAFGVLMGHFFFGGAAPTTSPPGP